MKFASNILMKQDIFFDERKSIIAAKKLQGVIAEKRKIYSFTFVKRQTIFSQL